MMGFISHISKLIWPPSEKPWYPFLSRLAETGRPVNELVATVVGTAVGSSVNYAQGMIFLQRISPIEFVDSRGPRYRPLFG
jgi:hypothetical protein